MVLPLGFAGVLWKLQALVFDSCIGSQCEDLRDLFGNDRSTGLQASRAKSTRISLSFDASAM